MRVSTNNRYNNSIDSLIQRQSTLATTQEQLTTGRSVNRASDDPTAAARAERSIATQARATASQRAVDASNNAMTLSESALADAGDLLQQARVSLVAAGNPAYSDADRKSLAANLSQLRDQLLTVANTSNGSGTYLFGGQGANQAPFIDAPGGVQFRGSAGKNTVASGDALPLTVDGRSAWMQAPTGNGTFSTSAVTSTGSGWIDPGAVIDPSQLTGSTYTIQFSVASGVTTYSVLKDGAATAQTGMPFKPGQAVQIDGMSATIAGSPANGDAFQIAPSTPTLTVFDALDKAITDLTANGRTGAQLAQANSTNIANLDSVLNQMQGARGEAGEVLNRIDGVTDRLSAVKLAGKTEESHATDLDMTAALSDFSNQQTGYDAALKAYSMVQGLSMFKYLT